VDNLEIHPLALAFPAYGEEDLAKLASDIRNHGLRQPIALFEGKVLDGRNRVEAARKAGLTHVPSKKFEGTFDEARDYVISLNLVRRHLDTGQRAMIAAELTNLPRGGDRSKVQNCTLKIDDAAKQLNVSPRTVKTAKAVKEADPALAEEVKQGKTKLSTAVRKTAALKTRPKVTTAKKGPAKIEVKRHEERMKSARYKLEQLFAIMPIWPNGNGSSRLSKHSLERNISDSLFHPSAGIWPLKSRTSGPFDDLIASMLTFGWIEEMPTILEYGVVIDGIIEAMRA
jgi:ParB-like chromosome segregation protein Spo0J